MNVLARLDRARAELDVLEHPFYRRWSAGELSAAELARYAREYRHAVIALARASIRAAEEAGPSYAPPLREHAREEAEHVELWERFERFAGASSGHGGEDAPDPLPETLTCARTWTAGEDVLEHLAVLYAIEASQPEIAKTKLDGLVERYGYTSEGPAVEYFELHATLDVEHARQARELIEELMSEDEVEAQAQAERMVARASAALRGNWALLDGVDRRFAHAD
jgi:pyrroloquinoline-quinone synthase